LGLGVSAFLIVVAFFTAMLSGIFGMAGGLILMGALALLLPVSAAFVTHGILQLVANGWRAVLQREHLQWRIVAYYVLASAVAGGVVMLLAFAPSKFQLFLLLGLTPFLVWVPPHWFALDATRPSHAMVSGFMVTALNLTAGVGGQLLDIFFVRTALTRHEIVATKAATQVFSHLVKITVYGLPMLLGATRQMPPVWIFAVAIPLSMLGTFLGGKVLARMSDVNFKRWTAWIVTGIGVLYLIKAAQLMP
jgi:uncharacterized protein